jgi:hypothetical protein
VNRFATRFCIIGPRIDFEIAQKRIVETVVDWHDTATSDHGGQTCDGEDVGELRSAAVRNLQRQRERQRVANRIEMGSNPVRDQDNMGVTTPTFMDLDSVSEAHLSGSNSAPSTAFASFWPRDDKARYSENLIHL